ncbi:MAG: DUF4168 domain-containing protein [Deltaproteobacteria bacterium]|nr:DUF4168 domain-containing protein [Deltaproteobacteria bacterium]
MQRPQRIALFVSLGAAAALFATLGRRDEAPPSDGLRPPAIERPAAHPDTGPGVERSASPTPVDPTGSVDPSEAPALQEPRAIDPGIDPADAPFVEAFGEPTPELVRAAIEAVVADLFVDRPLSPAELDRAAEALVELRSARAELDQLAMEPAQAERRRALVEALGQASETFREITQMSPAEFTARAAEAASGPTGRGGPGGGGGGGLDRDIDPDYVPDDDFLPPRGAAPETLP